MSNKFFFICLVAASCAQAQSLYNKSLISISPNSILFVNDSLVNNGTLINNGDIQISGAWINNAQYDAGDGQITFNSDLPQIINHNDQSFSTLVISGGGEKIFQANITIENELELSAGVLVSENDARIIFNNTAQVTGGSDIAHIQGAVYHKGSGTKTFPVGDGSLYLPVTLNNIEGADAEVGIRLFNLNGNTLDRALFLNKISDQRYWLVDVVSGSTENATVTLAVRDENFLSNESEVVVAQSAAVDAAFQSLGQASFQGTLSNGLVTSNESISFPYLAVGAVVDDGSVSVYNAVSPNNDGLNDFMRIHNIERFPENKVYLYNRWGDKVFEMSGYDNDGDGGKVFTGKRNVGGDAELPSGTYYYVVDRRNGSPLVNGYLSLKR